MAPLVIAHRGDSSRRPENTLAAFAAALDSGAEIVELDVQLTRDREVVVIHDPTLERTTSGAGPVAGLTLSEIKGLSAGYAERFGERWADERVPTLVEALEALRGRAQVLVEIKSESVGDDANGGIEARTVATLRGSGMSDSVALISFDRRALLRCRELAPELPRGHLFYRAAVAEVLEGARAAGTDLVMPHKGMLTDELFEAAAAANLRIATWVVDEPEELAQLLRWPVFAVGSNRPAELLAALRARR